VTGLDLVGARRNLGRQFLVGFPDFLCLLHPAPGRAYRLCRALARFPTLSFAQICDNFFAFRLNWPPLRRRPLASRRENKMCRVCQTGLKKSVNPLYEHKAWN